MTKGHFPSRFHAFVIQCNFIHSFALALRGSKDIVSLLLRALANVNEPDNMGYTPLCFAVREQHHAVAEVLLYNGATVNAITAEGMTPLHLACAGKDFSLVVLLVECGAELNWKAMNGMTPVQVARECGNEVMVNYLNERSMWKNSFREHNVPPANSFCTIMTFVQ